MDGCIDKRELPYDFYCKLKNGREMLIEYQGEQHYRKVFLWDGDKGFEERLKRDWIKREYAHKMGIPYLEIPYTKKTNLHNIIDEFIKTMVCDDEQLYQETPKTDEKTCSSILDVLNCTFS
jgi:hypothetical protein